MSLLNNNPQTIRVRQGTAANLALSTTYVLEGELLYKTDTKVLSIGDASNGKNDIAMLGVANIFTVKQTIQLATEQQRIGYDVSNYLSTTVSSTGSTTFALTGTSPLFTFSQGIINSTLTASSLVLTNASKQLISGTASNLATAGIPTVVASTFERAETGSDANVLTYTTGAADEFLNVQVATDVSAITGTSIVVTATWKDSNNTTATSTLTLTAIGDGTMNLPINAKTATSVVISAVFVGVSTAYNISAFITRLK